MNHPPLPCQCLACLWEREGKDAHRRIMTLILGQARAEAAELEANPGAVPRPSLVEQP